MSKPTDPIFKHLHKVKVPELAVIPKAELELLGVRATIVDGEVMRNDQTALTIVYLPVVRLVELFDSGFPIYILEPESISKIYHALENHIASWNKIIKTSLNLPNYPKDDLEKMDKFATEIFELNKATIYHESDSFNPYVPEMIFRRFDDITPTTPIDYSELNRNKTVPKGHGKPMYSAADILKSFGMEGK